MPKQDENPIWDYFKISNEDVSKAVCILCKKTIIKWEQGPSQNDNNNKLLEKLWQSSLWQNSGFGTSLLYSAICFIT